MKASDSSSKYLCEQVSEKKLKSAELISLFTLINFFGLDTCNEKNSGANSKNGRSYESKKNMMPISEILKLLNNQ